MFNIDGEYRTAMVNVKLLVKVKTIMAKFSSVMVKHKTIMATVGKLNEMIGDLGHDSAFVMLYWAGDKLC